MSRSNLETTPIPLDALVSRKVERRANSWEVQPAIIKAVAGPKETRSAHDLSILGFRAVHLRGIEDPAQVNASEVKKITVRTILGSREVRQEGHEVGDLVAVSAIPFFTEDGELVLRVNREKGLLADGFRVGKVSDEVREQLAQYEGAIDIGALLRVGPLEDKPEDEPGDHRYFAAQLHPEVMLTNINPSTAQLEGTSKIAGISRGAKVGIAGTVVSVTEEDPKWVGRTYLVKADQGDEIRVQGDQIQVHTYLRGEGLRYRKGPSADITGKPIREGDVVRVSALVEDDETNTLGKILIAGENEPVLDAPGFLRRRDHANLRDEVERSRQKVDETGWNGDFAGARQLYAVTRHNELTEGEAVRLDMAILNLPDHELPFYAGGKDINERVDIHGLEADYGVLVESMSEGEFLTFALKAAKGEMKKRQPAEANDPGPSDDSHILTVSKLVEERYGEEAAYLLLSEAVEARFDRLEQNPNMADRHAFDEAVHGLSTLSMPAATVKLAEVFLRCTDPGSGDDEAKPYYFTEFDATDLRIPEPLKKMVDAASKALRFSIKRNGGNAEYLLRKKPNVPGIEDYLHDAAEMLAKNPMNVNTNDLDRVLIAVDSTRDVLERHKVLPPKVNAH